MKKFLAIPILFLITNVLFAIEEKIEITVSASPIADVEALNTESIPEEKINQFNHDNVYSLLDKTSSITTGADYEGTIDIRGQGEGAARRNVQILMDNVPFNTLDNTSYLFHGFNNVPVNSLQSIEILRSGGAVLYGNGTQGGVIHFHTKYFSDEVSNYVKFSAGSLDTYGYGAALGHKFFDDTLKVQIEYFGVDSNAYLRGENLNSNYYAAAFTYKPIEDFKIGYSFTEYTAKGLFSKPVAESIVKEDYRASGELIDRDRNRQTHNFLAEGKVTDSLELSYSLFLTTDKKPWEQGGVSYRTEEQTLGNKLKAKNYYGDSNWVIVGVDSIASKQKVNTITTTNTVAASSGVKYDKDTTAGYILNKLYVTQNVYSTLGYRGNYDQWERTVADTNIKSNIYSNAYEGSLGYEISDHSNYYSDNWFRVERGFSAPNSRDFTNTINRENVANDIGYETYYVYELGTKNFIAKTGTSVDFAVFYIDTKDTVQTISIGGRNIGGVVMGGNRYAVNMGSSRRTGFDAGINQNIITDRLDAYANVSYVDSVITKPDTKQLEAISGSEAAVESVKASKGQKVGRVIPWVANTGVTWQVVLNYFVTFNVNYVAGHNPYQNLPDYKIGERVLADIAIKYSNGSLEVGAGLNNIFNKGYYIGSGEIPYDGIDPYVVRQGMKRNGNVYVKYVF